MTSGEDERVQNFQVPKFKSQVHYGLMIVLYLLPRSQMNFIIQKEISVD